MYRDQTLTSSELNDAPRGVHRALDSLGLVIAWSWSDPSRVGELAPIAPGVTILGRGPHRPSAPGPRLAFYRARPGLLQPCPPLAAPRLSRDQLRLDVSEGSISLSVIGRCPTRVNGREVTEAVVRPGDVIALHRQMVLLCVRHPGWLGEAPDRPLHPFGEVDEWGIVGESPEAWELRRQLRFLGQRVGHILISGESGTGKELAARALHALSAGGPFVARNASTIPEGLVEAELFGNMAGYPNAGMAERPGLIGAADGGTLYLDEFTTLSEPLQARLLRVLDSGEYNRLGEASARTARFRLVATTNQPDQAVRHDILPRFVFQLRIPSLNARRMDVPLILRHLLQVIRDEDPELRERFFDGDQPRVGEALVTSLLRRSYTTHVREIRTVLWRAIQGSRSDVIDIEPVAPAPVAWRTHVGAPPASIPPEVLQACLDEHNGNQEQTWRALGFNNRFVLNRLIKKHRLVIQKQR